MKMTNRFTLAVLAVFALTSARADFTLASNGQTYAGDQLQAALTAAAATDTMVPPPYVLSSNIHAMRKIEAAATNVLIAVPWTFYTPTGSSDTNLPVDRLVRPTNLTEGDLLLVVDGERQMYASWMLVKNDDDAFHHWEAATTVSKDLGLVTKKNLVTEADPNASIARGLGLWLIRQNPKGSNGEWLPFYLYGQWTVGGATAAIEGSAGTTNSVLVAHPGCRILAVNEDTDLAWSNVAAADVLAIPNGTDAFDYAHWDTLKSKWYVTKSTRTARGSVTQTKNYDITIPAGQGFWYSRRASGAATITFK